MFNKSFSKIKSFFKPKFLFLIPVSVLFAISLSVLFSGIIEGKFDEKFLEKRIALEMIGEQVEMFILQDDDWESEHQFYEDSLAFSIDILDSTPGVFAALYKNDLTGVSARTPTYEASPFDPLAYEEFLQAVRNNESGEIILWFEDKAHGVVGRDMKIYYRWVPLLDTVSDKYLTAVGISKLSIETKIADRVVYGVLGIMIGTIIVSGLMVLFIIRGTWR